EEQKKTGRNNRRPDGERDARAYSSREAPHRTRGQRQNNGKRQQRSAGGRSRKPRAPDEKKWHQHKQRTERAIEQQRQHAEADKISRFEQRKGNHGGAAAALLDPHKGKQQDHSSKHRARRAGRPG